MTAADIEDRKSFRAWLEGKSREVCVLLAARAALRVLPLFSSFAKKAKAPRQFADLTSVLFRATALAWAAGEHPAHASELVAALYAAADAAASNAADAAARNAAAYAAYAAADDDDAARNAAACNAAAYAAAAAFAAADAAARNAAASNAADAWEAIRSDVGIFERRGWDGLVATPLWAPTQPEWAKAAWGALKAALPAEEDWQVWTVWYEDRLEGVNSDEARDLIYAKVPTEVWNEGSAAANAWIRRELDKLRLVPFANRPAAISPEINSAGKLDVSRRPAALAYPNNRSEPERLALQSFCQTQASRLLEALRSRKFGNFLDVHFVDLIAFYLVDLPDLGREGTFLLADAQASELRDLAEEAAPILPSTFARRLGDLLKKHDELRSYYIEIADSDSAVARSKPLPAPPPAPLLKLQKALEDASPELVTPELIEQTKQVLRAAPAIELDEADRQRGSSPDTVHPPRRPSGAPSARQQHNSNVAVLLAKLNKLGGVSNVKDAIGTVGALHNVEKLVGEDIPALISEILKHWPF